MWFSRQRWLKIAPLGIAVLLLLFVVCLSYGQLLLAAAVGSLVLLSLLVLVAIGLELFLSTGSLPIERHWILRYGASVMAVVLAILLRTALTQVLGPSAAPFALFYPVVLFSAWFGGFRAGAMSVGLSTLAASYYFSEPIGSFLVRNRTDQVNLVVFVVMGFGIAWLTDWQRRTVARAAQAEAGERAEKQRFETTLAGIGDAVIATDAEGRITFANNVALALMRWPGTEIRGESLDSVFKIISEFTRAKLENPVGRVLREGKIVGLANHTILVAQDGTEVPIDDSAAPLRAADGTVEGAVIVFRDITERRKQEATGQLLAAIVKSSEDAIVSKDANGIVTSWNHGAEQVFRYSAQEMIGRPIAVLAPPDRQDEMREIMSRIRRGERVQPHPTIRRTKSGTLIHVSVSVSPIRDAAGHFVGGSEITRDISEQIEAQRELADQRERLSGIIDAAMDAIVTVDELQRIKVFNRAAERVFRCPASEALGQSIDTFIPERFRQGHRKHIERFGESGTTSRSMYRPGVLWGLRRDGEEFPFEATISQMEKNGERLFTVILRDITERKRIEDDLHRERERLRLSLTAGRMGVYEMNAATGVLWWSPETYALFGVKPGEFALTCDSFAALIHPADRDLFIRYWTENIAQHRPINREFRVLPPEGKERWISCRGLTLTQSDDPGPARRHTGVFLDITERKETEQVLRQFERLSAAARLSAAMAHEINNPLGAVVNLIYLAKTAPGVPPPVMEQLRLAEQELERVAHVARQSLGFYRESTAPEPVDATSVIDSMLEIYSNRIKRKKIHVRREFEEYAQVYIVRGELRQVVSNLLINAIDAVAEGGTIEIGCRLDESGKDSAVEITVADNGHGVAPENLDRIFEPFFTTKAETGTGLGLWVTKEIVERHKGTIAVSSPNANGHNRGTTFTITLPARREPGQPDPAPIRISTSNNPVSGE